jgi:tetratricopeptide (TPR) repeat protein
MIEQLNQIKLEMSAHENLKYINCVLEALITVITEKKAEDSHMINSHLSAIRHCIRFYLGKSQLSESLNQFITKANRSFNNADEMDTPSGTAIQSPNDSPALEKRMVEEQSYLEILTTHNDEVAIKMFLFECWANLIKQKKPSKKFFLSYAWPKTHDDLNNESWVTPYLARLAEHLILCGMQVYIDQFHSGPGKSLGGFMGKINEIVLSVNEQGENIVREIDHVLLVSSRTLPMKLSIPQSGCSYEQEQIRERIQTERSHRFIIPLLLNLRNYLPQYMQNLVGINFCSDPYLSNITELFKIVYKFGYDCINFCNQRIKHYGLGLDVYIASGLKEQYTSHNAANVQYLLYQQSVPVKDCFINLAVISEDEKKARENQLQITKGDDFRDNRIMVIENIQKPKEIIGLDDLWKPQGNIVQKYTHVLVEGLAGVGKTTLIQYLANQWALSSHEKKITWLNQFDAVIWLPLRKLHAYSQQTNLAAFIYNECISAKYQQLLSTDMIERYLLYNNKIKTLYLLDGLDEVLSLFDSSSTHREILNSLLKKENWLATARPGNIHTELFGQFRHLENVGFTDENINKYIKKFFFNRTSLTEDEQISKAKLLIQLIETNYTIKTIARIPIHLEFICSIWSEKVRSLKQDLSDITVTILYYKIISLLLRRYLLRLQELGLLVSQPGGSEDVLDLDDSEIFAHEKCHAPLAFLSEIGWQMMLNSSFIITTNVIRPTFKKYFPNKDKTIIDTLFKHLFILRPIGEIMRSALEQSYYITHFSFQEFLAAYYTANVMRLDNSKMNVKHINVADVKIFIAQNKYNPKYESVWWFTAGLFDSDELLNTYFHILDETDESHEGARDVIGFARTILKMHCLNEAQSKIVYSLTDESLMRPISQARVILQDIREWMKNAQWQGDKLNGVTKYLMDHLLACERIFQCTIIANSLIEFLNSIRDRNQIFFQVPVILYILAKRSSKDRSIIQLFKELMQAKNESLRMEAVRALGQIENVDNSLVEFIIDYSLQENFENHYPNIALETLKQFSQKQSNLVYDGLFRRIYTHQESCTKIRTIRMIASMEVANYNVDQKLAAIYQVENGEYKTNIAYAIIRRKKGIVDDHYIYTVFTNLDKYDSYEYILPELVAALSPYRLQITLQYLSSFIKNPNQIIQRTALIQMMEIINENEVLAQTILWPLLEEIRGFHLLKVFLKRLNVIMMFSTPVINLYIKCCNAIGLSRTRYSEQNLQNLFIDLTVLIDAHKELLIKIKQHFQEHNNTPQAIWPLGLALILHGQLDKTVTESLKKICKDNSITEIIKSFIYDSIANYILANKDKLLASSETFMLNEILEAIDIAVSPVKKCIARKLLGSITNQQAISELVNIIKSPPPIIDIHAQISNDFRLDAVQALLGLGKQNIPCLLSLFDEHEDLKGHIVFLLCRHDLSEYLLQLPTSIKQQGHLITLLSSTSLSHIIKACIANFDMAFLPIIIAKVTNDRISIYLQENRLYWYDVDSREMVFIDVTDHCKTVSNIIFEIEKALGVPYLEQNAYTEFNKGNFNIAIKYYKKLLDYVPDHKTAHHNLGCCYHILAMQDSTNRSTYLVEAESHFSTGMDSQPTLANSIEYANFLFMQNRYDETIMLLNKVVNSEAHNDGSLLSYGNIEQDVVPEQIRSLINQFHGQITLSPILFAYILLILLHKKIDSSYENIMQLLPKLHALVIYADPIAVSLFAAACKEVNLPVMAQHFLGRVNQLNNIDKTLKDLINQAYDNYTRKNFIVANKFFNKLCELYPQNPEIVIYAARCRYIMFLQDSANQKFSTEAEVLFKRAMQFGSSTGFIEYATFLYLRGRHHEALDYIMLVCHSQLLDGNILAYHFVDKLFVIPELRKAYPPEIDMSGTFGFPGFHHGNSIFVHDYVYAHALAIKIAHRLNHRYKASSLLATLTSILKNNSSQMYHDMLRILQKCHVKFLRRRQIHTIESTGLIPDDSNMTEFAQAPTALSRVSHTTTSILPSLLHLSLFAVASCAKQNKLRHHGHPVVYNPESGNVSYASTTKQLLEKDIAVSLKAIVRK